MKRTDRYVAFLHLTALALAVLVTVVSLQNRRLEAALQEAETAAAGLTIGERLPEVMVEDLTGERSRLSFETGSRANVFLIFTATCASCEDNLARWRDLYRRLGDTYRFVGISLDEAGATRDYAEAHDLTFPIFIPREPAAFIKAYGVTRVPLTLVMTGGGVALDARVGVLPRTYARSFAGYADL